MRRVVDLLLILILLLAVVYMFFILDDGTGGLSFGVTATPSQPVATVTRPPAIPPTIAPVTPGVSFTSTSAASPTASPTRTITPTRTPTPTASLTPTATTQATVQREISDSMLIGDEVVQAIESYYFAEGVYPPDLRSLVPGFLPEMRFTSTGREFLYRLFDPNERLGDEIYWVAFDVASQEHVSCTYYRRLQAWDCNFFSP